MQLYTIPFRCSLSQKIRDNQTSQLPNYVDDEVSEQEQEM